MKVPEVKILVGLNVVLLVRKPTPGLLRMMRCRLKCRIHRILLFQKPFNKLICPYQLPNSI